MPDITLLALAVEGTGSASREGGCVGAHSWRCRPFTGHRAARDSRQRHGGIHTDTSHLHHRASLHHPQPN
ncbi:hypothetical protein AL486_05140 [Pandoraea apista]|nr:hypothetical protein AL486_05140 [Pandoraea apista]